MYMIDTYYLYPPFRPDFPNKTSPLVSYYHFSRACLSRPAGTKDIKEEEKERDGDDDDDDDEEESRYICKNYYYYYYYYYYYISN